MINFAVIPHEHKINTSCRLETKTATKITYRRLVITLRTTLIKLYW